ncbi:MAG TPA: hypothetical protein VHL31_20650 [Geminicoccus sp.]|jgi:hypothetical protein|uniref:hypothetical protein n=1 Tax=Geminicoccus sp. TaxID=2024832 RepID=UPI002E2EFFC2|nr:hypothetical protein [Geminicoccus sp.]HEX2528691.1 hypothetical protein [Geminicoccus sp.]
MAKRLEVLERRRQPLRAEAIGQIESLWPDDATIEAMTLEELEALSQRVMDQLPPPEEDPKWRRVVALLETDLDQAEKELREIIAAEQIAGGHL